MKLMKTMLAAAAAALALAALPAVAAAQPELELDGSPHFTLAGGASELTTPESKATCKNVTGTGAFEGNPSTTGTVEFTFTECKALGTSCGTVSASTGEIELGPLDFHLVTATDVEGGDPVDAMLITPENPDPETTTGQIATFKCAFNLVKVEVDGTGLIGEIVDPDTNEASSTFEVEFARWGAEDTQTYEHIEVDGETSEHTYDLRAKFGNNEWETTVHIGSWTGTFTAGENTLIEG